MSITALLMAVSVEAIEVLRSALLMKLAGFCSLWYVSGIMTEALLLEAEAQD